MESNPHSQLGKLEPTKGVLSAAIAHFIAQIAKNSTGRGGKPGLKSERISGLVNLSNPIGP